MITLLGLYAFLITIPWELHLDAEICRYFLHWLMFNILLCIFVGGRTHSKNVHGTIDKKFENMLVFQVSKLCEVKSP